MASNTEVQDPPKKAPKHQQYVVVSDAVSVHTGGKDAKGNPKGARVLRKAIIEGPESSEQIQQLLRLGSIRPVSGDEEIAAARQDSQRLTVGQAVKYSGAEDDPVKAPVQDVLPSQVGAGESAPIGE